MMRFAYTVLTGSIFFVLFSCKKNPELRTSTSISGKNCTLVEIETDHINVCLDSLIEDSRCPRGVVCNWEGTAIAKFSVTVNNHQQPVTLSTLKLRFPSDTIIMGYKIEFVDLLPYPEINKSHDISEYRAEIKITKH